jgi:hypothetical protein
MGIKIRHTRALLGFLPIGFRVSATHCHPYSRPGLLPSCRDNHSPQNRARPHPETSVAPPLGSRLSSPPAGVWHLPRSLFLGSASTETVVVLPPPHSCDSRIRMPVANAPLRARRPSRDVDPRASSPPPSSSDDVVYAHRAHRCEVSRPETPTEGERRCGGAATATASYEAGE